MTHHERKPIRLTLLCLWCIINVLMAALLDFPELLLPWLLTTFIILCVLALGSIHDIWWHHSAFKLIIIIVCYVLWLIPWPSASIWLLLTSWVLLLVFIDEIQSRYFQWFICLATALNITLSYYHLPEAFFLSHLFHQISLAILAIAINHHLLQEQDWVIMNASIEPLSGGFSGSQLTRRLVQEEARSLYTGKAITLLMFRIQDFDLIVDNLPLRGLKQFLNAFRVSLATQLRAGDEVYYLKHGDFLLLLPNCSHEGAAILKERLGRQLETRSWPVLGKLQLIAAMVTQKEQESTTALLTRIKQQLSKQQQTALRLVAFAED